MRYKNAQDIFPDDILLAMQQFVDGAYIYIPRKSENRKKWGDSTRSKIETQERNNKIYAKYKSGSSINELAIEYFLSEKSIQRIITLGNKLNKKATPSLSEGNGSSIHSRCSGGGLGAVPPLSGGNCESNFLANEKRNHD